MEKENETYKIRLFSGRIITLSLARATATHLFGFDKFGTSVIINREDIDTMLAKMPPKDF